MAADGSRNGKLETNGAVCDGHPVSNYIANFLMLRRAGEHSLKTYRTYFVSSPTVENTLRHCPFTFIRSAYSPCDAVMKSVLMSAPPKHTFAVHPASIGICPICSPLALNTVTPLPVR